MKNWHTYKLKDFLIRQYDTVLIDDLKTYKRITIKTKGQGIELRDSIGGTEIGTKNQYRVKANQFLLSKIDAMNGAFGIVPETCHNGIITGNFWVYDFDENLIDGEYLRLLCRKQVFTNFSLAASEGTTNRRYLREEKFLNLELSLPPLQEQKRIISEIEIVNLKLEQIKSLRKEQSKDIKNLIYSKYSEIIEGADWYPMRIVAPIVRRDVVIDESALYPEVGLRSFGKGTFHKPALTGLEVGTKTLYQVKSGDLLFSNVFAWEGAIAVVKYEDDDRFGSHRFISCEVDKNQAIAEFLCYHFLTPKGLEDINHASPGGAGRNKTLGLEKLMRINVPVPNIELQKEFVELFHKIEALREHHKQTENELGELMPSLLDKAFKGEL